MAIYSMLVRPPLSQPDPAAPALWLRRPFQQQRRNFAGVAAHRHHPRAWLAAVTYLRDIDAIGDEPLPGRIHVRDAPGHAPQRVARGIGMLARPVRHLD